MRYKTREGTCGANGCSFWPITNFRVSDSFGNLYEITSVSVRDLNDSKYSDSPISYDSSRGLRHGEPKLIIVHLREMPLSAAKILKLDLRYMFEDTGRPKFTIPLK